MTPVFEWRTALSTFLTVVPRESGGPSNHRRAWNLERPGILGRPLEAAMTAIVA